MSFSLITTGVPAGAIGLFQLTGLAPVRRVEIWPLTAQTQLWTYSDTGAGIQHNLPTGLALYTGTTRNQVYYPVSTTTAPARSINFINESQNITHIAVRNCGVSSISGAIYGYQGFPFMGY